ncbi:hypothetical protein [Lysobacter terrae]
MRIRWLSTVLVTLLVGCGGGERYDEYDYSAGAADAAEEARQATYEERGADSDGTGADVSNVNSYDVENRGSYVCTDDCSGHEAGFEWAQENDIGDASDCGGNSQSFIEGCEAFAEERQEQADREAQDAAEEAAAEAEADAEYERGAEEY